MRIWVYFVVPEYYDNENNHVLKWLRNSYLIMNDNDVDFRYSLDLKDSENSVDHYYRYVANNQNYNRWDVNFVVENICDCKKREDQHEIGWENILENNYEMEHQKN